MNSSETIANLADALVRANLVIVNPMKDRTARAGSYSYRYVGLDTITAEMRPILQAHGLCIVQEIANDGITTRILHSSGEWLEMGPLNLPGGDDAQSRGSASTYGRRYTYCAALGIAADEDDDGAKAKRKTSHETIAHGEGATGSEGDAGGGQGTSPATSSGEGVAGKATPSPDSTSAPRTVTGDRVPPASVGTVSPTAGAPTERVGADLTSGPSGAKPDQREAQATAPGPDDAGVGSADVTASVEPPAPHRCDFVDWPEKPGGWERCNFPGCNAKQKKRAA